MNLQSCRNIKSEEACAHLITNAICFPFLFYRKRWQPECVTKNYPLKKSKVPFPSYCRVQEHDSSHGLSLLVNPQKQESWEPQLLSQLLLSNVKVVKPKYAARNLIWAAWLIEKKKNHIKNHILAPLSGIRTSSAITIANSAPAAKALLKFRADLQTSCFEMKSATLLSFSFVSWYAFSFLTATDY